jgi:predicted RNase H-like nuclease
MSPFRQRLVYEGNPELSYYQLNRDSSIVSSKRAESGRDERLEILESHIPGIDGILETEFEGFSEEHVFDAMALMWTARRVYGHGARRIPTDPEWDSAGLRMELVY